MIFFVLASALPLLYVSAYLLYMGTANFAAYRIAKYLEGGPASSDEIRKGTGLKEWMIRAGLGVLADNVKVLEGDDEGKEQVYINSPGGDA